MPSTDTPTVRARRQRLSQWIDEHYGGQQAEFIGATELNQGLVSALVRGPKSFGEKLATSIEQKAGMPSGYLVNPTDDWQTAAVRRRKLPIEKKLEDAEQQVDELGMVVGSLFTVMLRHRPAEAEEFLAQLDALPARFQDGELLTALRRVARAGKARSKSAS